MPTKTETMGAGAHLLSEANGFLSRETVTILAATGVLLPGTVLGKITASGKFAEYKNAATDGTQVAAGVLFDKVDASGAADVKAVATVRHAEVVASRLNWNAAQSAADKTAGLADLAAAYVIAR